MSATIVDRDLVVDTKNQFGAQSVTRRFRVAPGTTEVAVRYRFQSDERRIGQLTGSYANDWYEVVIRAIGAGAQARDTQAVSSLWFQFDGNHTTPWYTLRLPVTIPTDTVEVTLTAANAVDNAFLGLLYADIVQETVTQITELALNDMHATAGQIEELVGLSASAHPAYEGNTRIHGTIAVTGDVTDFLTSIDLQILENHSVRAIARLADGVGPSLLDRPFGSNGVSIAASRLLFELPSAQAQLLNQTTDDDALRLRVIGRTAQGRTVERELNQNIRKYVYYTDTHLGFLEANVVQETFTRSPRFSSTRCTTRRTRIGSPSDHSARLRERVAARGASDVVWRFTRFHGTVTVHGPATDSLQDVCSRSSRGRRSCAPIWPVPRFRPRGALLGQPLGPNEEISLTASTLRFELSPAQAALFNQNTDRDDLLIRVVSLTTSGVRRQRELDRRVNKPVRVRTGVLDVGSPLHISVVKSRRFLRLRTFS